MGIGNRAHQIGALPVDVAARTLGEPPVLHEEHVPQSSELLINLRPIGHAPYQMCLAGSSNVVQTIVTSFMGDTQLLGQFQKRINNPDIRMHNNLGLTHFYFPCGCNERQKQCSVQVPYNSSYGATFCTTEDVIEKVSKADHALRDQTSEYKKTGLNVWPCKSCDRSIRHPSLPGIK